MAIKKIRISNFKSFTDLEIEFGKFNVLIGANASGKSNFIHQEDFRNADGSPRRAKVLLNLEEIDE